MQLSVGTSGYSYKEWKGSFYPAKLPASEMLGFYTMRFTTVEINNTFYRMPDEKVLAEWLPKVPDSFTFSLKMPRRISHVKRLRDTESDLAEFLRRTSILGNKLGPLLVQLPPFMKLDLPTLEQFLVSLPSDRQVAFEFRHSSWQDESVVKFLREHAAILCVAETDEQQYPLVSTSRLSSVPSP